MTRVAVVGHVEWVDFIPVMRMPRQGEVIHAEGAFARAAGGGGVVSVVLAELGAVSAHVAWRKHPTRRALTLLERDGERTIVTVGERLEPFGSDDLEWERLRGAEGAYFTAGDAAALRRARDASVVVASPRGRAALRDGPSIEALVYSGRDHDECEWARRLEGNARLLVETRGALGGVWRGESEGSWSAVAPEAETKDAYGCGDSFAAGFTFALATGASVAEAVALGARCGARCLTRAGAP